VKRVIGVLTVAATFAVVSPSEVGAQGCVCQRQGGPVFGGVGPYLNQGDWQLLFYYRGYESTEHFRGRNPFTELDGNGPLNRQSYSLVEATYGISRRLNLSLSVPLLINDFDVFRPPPGQSDRVWVPISASGLGDIAVKSRLWLLDPDGPNSGSRNVGLSLGVKLPTGKKDRTDDYFGRQVPVDVSIQTGDGVWAGTASLYAFQNVDPVTLYATGEYLVSPANTTEVPTFFGSLFNPNNTTFNSAADQFSAQLGASVSIKEGWPLPSLAYRIEGVPVSDLIGDSDGFRRPGVIGFIEPGLTYPLGRHLISATLAIRTHVNIKDSPTSTRVEDATVPKYMFMAAYSVRF